jgi:uncharacterized protein
MAGRLLFAWDCKALNLRLTNDLTGDSRLMRRRPIQDRVRTSAPFLRLDHAPDLVISEGRLCGMQDAYTTSAYCPDSQPLPELGLHDIRHAVKVVIDAYTGTVDFSMVDPSDPVAATSQPIFPGLFTPFEAMPQALQPHIRSPEDLFVMQAHVDQAYPRATPNVFSNRADLWQFPRAQAAGEMATMAPYSIIMRLPGEPEAEFFLMLPMVPSQRDNLMAWVAARCDLPHYGTLLVYELPKDTLVYGPFQIEARMNQTTESSQQCSRSNQMGSRVIRGHLLVIPIETAILSVSPLYLRAETGPLPELKRVIAA